ncbi:EAL domain-containing protein [Pseudochrobactrum sp. HB0163]|uniref:EAL domain-containing protein n=1 Tax=Pseudochrobactrum sp. HB0163 TaxID=3450708 RepID=UPI003F6E0C0B
MSAVVISSRRRELAHTMMRAGNRQSPLLELGLSAERIVNLSSPDKGSLYEECLARLLVNEEVLLKGADFVSDLEAAGCIGVLDVAVADMMLDTLSANPFIRLGCNISPFTLADNVAWNALMRKLAARPRLAARVTLEITESAPLDEIGDVAARLRQAKACGCRIALDDFGAGYAKAGRLRHVDIDWDIIKLDRSFLKDLRKTPAGRDGLASAVALASCFAPMVVVEGIETKAQLALARASGAHFGQGWLFKADEAPLCWHRLNAEASRSIGGAMQKNIVSGHLFEPAYASSPVAGHKAKTGSGAKPALHFQARRFVAALAGHARKLRPKYQIRQIRKRWGM